MKYLFSELDSVIDQLRNWNLFLFLDFDGTLAPIAQQPQSAVISEENRQLLVYFSKEAELKAAVISGRSLQDIKRMTAVEGIIYAGNHGMEMEGPDFHFEHPLPAGYRENLDKLRDILQRDLADVKGILFEEKGYGLSIHYRNAASDSLPRLLRYLDQAGPLFSQNNVRLHCGKMVFELKPSLQWDKGKTVLWLLERQRTLISGKTLYPVYIGDDRTDEDAFEALKNLGLTVVVEKSETSAAQYYFNDTADVTRFLRQIADLKKND